MIFEGPYGWVAKFLVWSWIGGVYLVCLSPVWSDGLTWRSVVGVLVLETLATYILTLVHHDLHVFADRVTRLLERLKR